MLMQKSFFYSRELDLFQVLRQLIKIVILSLHNIQKPLEIKKCQNLRNLILQKDFSIIFYLHSKNDEMMALSWVR